MISRDRVGIYIALRVRAVDTFYVYLLNKVGKHTLILSYFDARRRADEYAFIASTPLIEAVRVRARHHHVATRVACSAAPSHAHDTGCPAQARRAEAGEPSFPDAVFRHTSILTIIASAQGVEIYIFSPGFRRFAQHNSLFRARR